MEQLVFRSKTTHEYQQTLMELHKILDKIYEVELTEKLSHWTKD
jgi:hypothetical protein